MALVSTWVAGDGVGSDSGGVYYRDRNPLPLPPLHTYTTHTTTTTTSMTRSIWVMVVGQQSTTFLEHHDALGHPPSFPNVTTSTPTNTPFINVHYSFLVTPNCCNTYFFFSLSHSVGKVGEERKDSKHPLHDLHWLTGTFFNSCIYIFLSLVILYIIHYVIYGADTLGCTFGPWENTRKRVTGRTLKLDHHGKGTPSPVRHTGIVVMAWGVPR